MAKKVGKIAKEKKPFDKTYIPLTFAFIILALLVGALVYTIIQKPKDKPYMNETNTALIEEIAVDNKNTICSNDELNELIDKAKKITAKYEEINDYVFYKGYNENSSVAGIEPEEIEVTGYALRMTIENLSSDFTVLVKNNIDDTMIYNNNITDGTLIWDEGTTTYVRTYYVEIYSNRESCKKVPLRSFSFQVPKWNEISKLGICVHEAIKDKEICKHFTFDNKSLYAKLEEMEEEAIKAGKEEYKKKEEEKKSSLIIFVKNHFALIIIIIGILITVVVIVVIVLKGRKNNEKRS